MDRIISRSLVAGCERVAAWADLLDAINVFPVADGDTGRNLKISLAPLIGSNGAPDRLPQMLIESATGNSGNIAAAFFSRFLEHAEPGGLGACFSAGRKAAWQSLADPKPGTMLTIFDTLAQISERWPADIAGGHADSAIEKLDAAVRATTELLPELNRAGVVDAGALGMFIFFEGFFHRLAGERMPMPPVTERFGGLLTVSEAVAGGQFSGYCVNTTLRSRQVFRWPSADEGLGESVVAVADGDRLRVHLHTRDHREAREKLERLGEIVDWQVDAMIDEPAMPRAAAGSQTVHIMTDAAGSLTREEARQLGVTLLDSHLVVGSRSVPETLLDPRELYAAMADGLPVSTAQASVFQKRQSYESVLGQYGRAIYLSVGSVYTGNYLTACQWREENGHGDRFAVIDTGAASGRLGLIVRQVARAAQLGQAYEDLVTLAHRVGENCDELVFLDQLKFLAAGGRISKSKGFFGDLIGIKPVIRPTAEGAAKAGTVRKASEQMPFAVEYLKQRYSSNARLTILLQFSDNEQRVCERIRPEIERQFPEARIEVTRLSLTSGAHMGPGTWAVAFCPQMTVV
ncbi:dihydroxyacetone kinase [Desulfosarcina widdelii]|uniref:Dihydroxyacetone kinase n=1 Tax=Desulfosarcina widdelii TaxID=947919 RepID=A0A5K7ZD62_9BACT|nr:DegV family protein [Desulfosarcina widdelii]BBO76394.1 dihydroxyacetone kinase [Desulfosarcina widdelii]